VDGFDHLDFATQIFAYSLRGTPWEEEALNILFDEFEHEDSCICECEPDVLALETGSRSYRHRRQS
jgi:hypothetical protein